MIFSLLKSLFALGSNKVATKNIDALSLKNLLKEHPGTQLLDVRGVTESRESGTLPGALVAPVNSPALTAAAQHLDKDKPLVVFCRSGARSRMACSYLKTMGFTDLYNLSGGYMGWQRNEAA
jgi:rhodanese-related sulfurtransferase